MAKLCLNMIVRDETHVLKRCFDSIIHLIDLYVILDTGSKDHTIELITSYMQSKGIPGKVYSDTWIDDFGYSRTKALDLARKEIRNYHKVPLSEANWKKKEEWYVMFMDADNQVFSHNGKDKLKLNKSELIEDEYRILMRQSTDDFDYTWIVKVPEWGFDHRSWRWEGELHEFVCTDDWKHKIGFIEGGYVLTGREGARNRNPNKLIKDIYILSCAVTKQPKNVRNWYYLARSYAETGNKHEAIRCYEKRASMGGWIEEVYHSYLSIALYYQNDKPDKFVFYLTKAINSLPERLEAPYYLMDYYRNQNMFAMGWIVAQGALAMFKDNHYSLFVNREIKEWKFYDVASLCAYYAGNRPESSRLCRRILSSGKIPDHEIERIKNNFKFYNNP